MSKTPVRIYLDNTSPRKKHGHRPEDLERPASTSPCGSPPGRSRSRSPLRFRDWLQFGADPAKVGARRTVDKTSARSVSASWRRFSARGRTCTTRRSRADSWSRRRRRASRRRNCASWTAECAPSSKLRLQIVYERRARYTEVPRICSGETRFVKHGMSNALLVVRIAVQIQKTLLESRMQWAALIDGLQCVTECCLVEP